MSAKENFLRAVEWPFENVLVKGEEDTTAPAMAPTTTQT